MSSVSENYTPSRRKHFRKIRDVERHKRLCLALPVSVMRSEIPYGYIEDPENPGMAIADMKCFELLLKAKQYLRTCTYKATSDWLTVHGYPISHNGLFKLMRDRQPYASVALPLKERYAMYYGKDQLTPSPTSEDEENP